MTLKTRLAKLEATATPARLPVVIHWLEDDLYSVNGDAYTLAAFRARYGGDPGDVARCVQEIGLRFSDI